MPVPGTPSANTTQITQMMAWAIHEIMAPGTQTGTTARYALGESTAPNAQTSKAATLPQTNEGQQHLMMIVLGFILFLAVVWVPFR